MVRALTVCLGIVIPVIGTLMSFLGIALAFFFVYPCWMWSRNEGLARVLSRLREAGQLGCLRLHRWLGAQGAGGLPQLGPADGQNDGAMVVVALPQRFEGCLHYRYSMRGSNQFRTTKTCVDCGHRWSLPVIRNHGPWSDDELYE